jgi:hypothetical protein
MSELLDLLRAAKPCIRLEWPGKTGCFIHLHVATHQIRATALLEAEKIFKDRAIGLHNMRDFETEKTIQTLYKITKTTDDKDFCTISEFRKLLTDDIIIWLDDQHELLQEKHSPNIEEMSEKEFDKLIEDLKKKPEETLLDTCSIYTLRRVVMFLVSPVAPLPTGN